MSTSSEMNVWDNMIAHGKLAPTFVLRYAQDKKLEHVKFGSLQVPKLSRYDAQESRRSELVRRTSDKSYPPLFNTYSINANATVLGASASTSAARADAATTYVKKGSDYNMADTLGRASRISAIQHSGSSTLSVANDLKMQLAKLKAKTDKMLLTNQKNVSEISDAPEGQSFSLALLPKTISPPKAQRVTKEHPIGTAGSSRPFSQPEKVVSSKTVTDKHIESVRKRVYETKLQRIKEPEKICEHKDDIFIEGQSPRVTVPIGQESDSDNDEKDGTKEPSVLGGICGSKSVEQDDGDTNRRKAMAKQKRVISPSRFAQEKRARLAKEENDKALTLKQAELMENERRLQREKGRTYLELRRRRMDKSAATNASERCHIHSHPYDSQEIKEYIKAKSKQRHYLACISAADVLSKELSRASQIASLINNQKELATKTLTDLLLQQKFLPRYRNSSQPVTNLDTIEHIRSTLQEHLQNKQGSSKNADQYVSLSSEEIIDILHSPMQSTSGASNGQHFDNDDLPASHFSADLRQKTSRKNDDPVRVDEYNVVNTLLRKYSQINSASEQPKFIPDSTTYPFPCISSTTSQERKQSDTDSHVSVDSVTEVDNKESSSESFTFSFSDGVARLSEKKSQGHADINGTQAVGETPDELKGNVSPEIFVDDTNPEEDQDTVISISEVLELQEEVANDNSALSPVVGVDVSLQVSPFSLKSKDVSQDRNIRRNNSRNFQAPDIIPATASNERLDTLSQDSETSLSLSYMDRDVDPVLLPSSITAGLQHLQLLQQSIGRVNEIEQRNRIAQDQLQFVEQPAAKHDTNSISDRIRNEVASSQNQLLETQRQLLLYIEDTRKFFAESRQVSVPADVANIVAQAASGAATAAVLAALDYRRSKGSNNVSSERLVQHPRKSPSGNSEVSSSKKSYSSPSRATVSNYQSPSANKTATEFPTADTSSKSSFVDSSVAEELHSLSIASFIKSVSESVVSKSTLKNSTGTVSDRSVSSSDAVASVSSWASEKQKFGRRLVAAAQKMSRDPTVVKRLLKHHRKWLEKFISAQLVLLHLQKSRHTKSVSSGATGAQLSDNNIIEKLTAVLLTLRQLEDSEMSDADLLQHQRCIRRYRELSELTLKHIARLRSPRPIVDSVLLASDEVPEEFLQFVMPSTSTIMNELNFYNALQRSLDNSTCHIDARRQNAVRLAQLAESVSAVRQEESEVRKLEHRAMAKIVSASFGPPTPVEQSVPSSTSSDKNDSVASSHRNKTASNQVELTSSKKGGENGFSNHSNVEVKASTASTGTVSSSPVLNLKFSGSGSIKSVSDMTAEAVESISTESMLTAPATASVLAPVSSEVATSSVQQQISSNENASSVPEVNDQSSTTSPAPSFEELSADTVTEKTESSSTKGTTNNGSQAETSSAAKSNKGSAVMKRHSFPLSLASSNGEASLVLSAGFTDFEARLKALREELAERRKMANRLKQEYKQRHRDRLLETEKSIKRQIDAYDRFIQQTTEQIRELETSNMSRRASTPPRILSPRRVPSQKSSTTVSENSSQTNTPRRSHSPSPRDVNPASRSIAGDDKVSADIVSEPESPMQQITTASVSSDSEESQHSLAENATLPTVNSEHKNHISSSITEDEENLIVVAENIYFFDATVDYSFVNRPCCEFEADIVCSYAENVKVTTSESFNTFFDQLSTSNGILEVTTSQLDKTGSVATETSAEEDASLSQSLSEVIASASKTVEEFVKSDSSVRQKDAAVDRLFALIVQTEIQNCLKLVKGSDGGLQQFGSVLKSLTSPRNEIITAIEANNHRGSNEHLADQVTEELMDSLLLDSVTVFKGVAANKINDHYQLPLSSVIGERDLRRVLELARQVSQEKEATTPHASPRSPLVQSPRSPTDRFVAVFREAQKPGEATDNRTLPRSPNSASDSAASKYLICDESTTDILDISNTDVIDLSPESYLKTGEDFQLAVNRGSAKFSLSATSMCVPSCKPDNVRRLVKIAVESLYDQRTSAESLANAVVPQKLLDLNLEKEESVRILSPLSISHESDQHFRWFIFELCRFIVCDMHSRSPLNQPQPHLPNNEPPPRLQLSSFIKLPLASEDQLVDLVQKHVNDVLRLGESTASSSTKPRTLLNRKLDKVDQILLTEIYHEEPIWTDYKHEELIVKRHMTDTIWDALITECIDLIQKPKS